jgi:hypothetical protein
VSFNWIKIPTDGQFYIPISGLTSTKAVKILFFANEGVKILAIDEGGVPVPSTRWRMARREAAMAHGMG